MLQKATVEPKTLELLKKLMADDNTKAFALAGGTSLSLQLNHRKSIDLDFFSNIPFNSNTLYNDLKSKGFQFNPETLELANNTINCHINDIKVQFLSHIYNQVAPIKVIEDIRLYDLPDIAAMKLNAITNRGSKKDFWDYAELLNKYSLKEMLSFYEKKYELKNFQHVFKSLTYFTDADSEKDPVTLNNKKWPEIKKSVEASVKKYFNERINIVSDKSRNKDKGLFM